MTTLSLNRIFSALADPTRRAILARLASGEKSVKELSRPFKISAPAITKHLKVLQQVGLIKRSRQAQWRPVRLNAKPLQAAADWIATYRQFWGESFDQHLKEMQKGG